MPIEYYRLTASGEVKPSPDYDGANFRVALDTVFFDVDVSTVFLSLNHSFTDGPPLVFETMVFGGPLDGEQDRYSTRADALAGHARMVERVRAEGPTQD
jgi:hypothetical protein